jgi:hypothetical protein
MRIMKRVATFEFVRCTLYLTVPMTFDLTSLIINDKASPPTDAIIRYPSCIEPSAA